MVLTITTWNVQNLAPSDPVFADKVDFLVTVLQALDPDVIALQEILDQAHAGDEARVPTYRPGNRPKLTSSVI